MPPTSASQVRNPITVSRWVFVGSAYASGSLMCVRTARAASRATEPSLSISPSSCGVSGECCSKPRVFHVSGEQIRGRSSSRITPALGDSMAPIQLSENVPAASAGESQITSFVASSIFTSLAIGLPATV